MKEDQYLKFIFHEDLYLIEEQSEYHDFSEHESDESSVEDSESSLVREPEPVSYFGSNEKGILILIHDSGNSFLKQKDLDFLMRIIESGLRYSKNDLALVNIARHSLERVLEEIEHEYIISFGINEISWESRPFYQLYESNEVVHLPAHSLSEIALDESKKRKLWGALKSMFNI